MNNLPKGLALPSGVNFIDQHPARPFGQLKITPPPSGLEFLDASQVQPEEPIDDVELVLDAPAVDEFEAENDPYLLEEEALPIPLTPLTTDEPELLEPTPPIETLQIAPIVLPERVSLEWALAVDVERPKLTPIHPEEMLEVLQQFAAYFADGSLFLMLAGPAESQADAV